MKFVRYSEIGRGKNIDPYMIVTRFEMKLSLLHIFA